MFVLIITCYDIGFALGYLAHFLWSFSPAGVTVGLVYCFYRIGKGRVR